MTTVLRAVVAFLTLSLVLGVGAVAAASPTPQPNTLGAKVAGYVYADENPAAYVINTGSVVTTFDATAPEGWAVTPKSINLRPGEHGSFVLNGSGDGGNLIIEGYSADAAKVSSDVTHIKFASIKVMQSRPFDLGRYMPALLFAALVILAVVFLLWRTKPWRYRLTRT